MNRRKFLSALMIGAPAAVALPAVAEKTGIVELIKNWVSYPEHETITLPGQNLSKGILYDKPLIPNLKREFDYTNVYFDRELVASLKDKHIRLAAIRSSRPVYFDMKPRQFFRYDLKS